MRVSNLLVAALAAALTAAGGASARSHVLPVGDGGGGASLAALWRLDEGDGATAFDATAQGHDGAYEGSPSLGAAGAPALAGDAAVGFDGSSGVQVPYSAALNSDTYTVEAWVDPAALPPPLDLGVNAKSIVCSRSADGGVRGWMLYMDDYVGHPQFAFVVGAGSSRRYVYDASGAAVQTGRWYHVAGSYDGANLHLYVNGVEVTGPQLNDGGGSTIAPNTDQPLEIGECRNAGGGGGLHGTIDDPAVWDGALDASTIAQRAATGIPAPAGGWPGQHGGSDSGGSCTGDRCLDGAPQKNPLVFVPGILGSAIADPCGSPDKDPWPGALFDSSRLDHIAMDPDGTNKSGECPRPDGVLLEVLGQDVYNTAWTDLKSAGYVVNKTLYAFPYDWRRSATYNARQLLDYVAAISFDTGKKVDILAHSQGGLVTMAMLRMPDSVGFVRRVITMATPAEGAAKAFSVLEYHSPCVVSPLDLKLFKVCPLNMGIVQRDVENMPGFYELLPAPYYGSAVGIDALIGTNGVGLIYPDWLDFVAQDHNRALLEATTDFHYGTIDPFVPRDPSVRMERFIGNHHSTLVAIRLERVCFWTRTGRHCSTQRHKVMSTLGDGTVPLNSADLQNTHNAFDERHGIPNLYFGFNHLGLTQHDASMNAAISFFGRATVALRRFSAADEGDLDPGPPSAALQVQVLGDTTTWVGDLGGGTIGETAPDGSPIDGATDDSSEGSASFSFDDPGAFTAHVTATDDGPVRVLVTRFSDTVQQQSIFYVPSVQAGGHLTLPFASDADLAQLRLDTPDGELAPTATTTGAVPNDVTPSTTIAGANLSAPGTSTVTLLARDDPRGVGVAATYYALDGASAPTLYTGLFEAPLYSTLHYWSVDRLGNVEDEQTIVVDDASNFRELAAPIHDGDMLDRTIWPAGDDDWFTFAADGSSNYRAQIVGLTHDYDLELYDAAGNLLQAPHARSNASEQLRSVLPAGTYYLRVLGFRAASDQDHPYELKLQTLGR
jgi:hypothetical protein